jgi:selenocysteine-specific elongation factor
MGLELANAFSVLSRQDSNCGRGILLFAQDHLRFNSKMKSVIIGTAGHIDHGKSALVRALTGSDPDRLPEEKRRGITIDLGFADLELDDVRLGFVDVPGHERFVKNMLAGAHGIDLVALVIAADEGVMPQTREHFEICRLLGVRNGLVVITKTDLVEEELVPLVIEEAEQLVSGSFLEGAPIVAASAKTGTGIDQLKDILLELSHAVPDRAPELVTMLPVDRAFTMKGFGAVVTGTLVSGEIAAGSELELLPAHWKVRARGLQVHGQEVSRAFAGQRTAVNLGGVDTSALERGMVLTPVGSLEPTQILDVFLEVLKDAPRPLRSRARVRLHLRAAEVLGRVRVLEDSGEIGPGESGFVQLRLESPVVAVVGEHFILRSYSPAATIAGGQILNPHGTKFRRRDLVNARARLAALRLADRWEQFASFVLQAGARGLRLSEVGHRTGWNNETVTKTVAQAKESGKVIECEGVFIAPELFQTLSKAVIDDVTAHHKRDPLAKGLARETLRERHFTHIPPEIFRSVLLDLERAGSLVSEKDVVRAREHSLELTGEDAKLRDRLEQTYKTAALEPPSLEAAFQAAGVTRADVNRGRKILQMLLEGKTLIRCSGDLIFHQQAIEGLTAKLRDYADLHEPQRAIDVATFKDLAGVSRKYAIPLLELLDRERITRREGDRRVVMKGPGQEKGVK